MCFRNIFCIFILIGTLAANGWSQSSKSAGKYAKLRGEALKKYHEGGEASFRQKVNESYQEKQREHGEYALVINTAEANRPLVQRSDENKLLVEEPLYGNVELQNYVNRVGQSLVPASSQQLYAFRVTLNPYPEARALSNGTIYLSTGLLSLLENEAQLAYVLSHEIAHLEKNHWFEDVMIESLVRARNERKLTAMNIAQKASSNLLRAFTGWFDVDPLVFRMYDSFGAASLAKAAFPRTKVTWDKVQEDEADKLGVALMLARGYDPNEAKRFYEKLKNAGKSEATLQQSFTASSDRTGERIAMLDSALAEMPVLTVDQQVSQAQLAATLTKSNSPGKALLGTRTPALNLTPEQTAKLKNQPAARQLITNASQFNGLLATVKRDNGVRAYHYDLFSLARLQLDEAVKLRGNDALARFYRGRVLMQTARTPQERQAAQSELRQAMALDARLQAPELRGSFAKDSTATNPTLARRRQR